MDIVGKYFLIKKHTIKGSKRSRRATFGPEDFENQRKLAEKYSKENQGEDFLIVQVVEEISGKVEKEGYSQ